MTSMQPVDDSLVPHVPVHPFGFSVSRIGLGTVKFGRTEGLRYPGTQRLPTDNELSDLLALAKDRGINLLDTAPSYGIAEQRIGSLLKNDRPHWRIIGKAGEVFDQGRSRFDLRPDSITTSLERSLTRLQTDYLDVFLVHYTSAISDVLAEDLIERLLLIKDRGLATVVGASTHSVLGAERALNRLDTILHPLDINSGPDHPVLCLARALGKPVFVKKGLECGYAADPATSIRSILERDGVTSLLIGTTNPTHLRSNIAAASTVGDERSS